MLTLNGASSLFGKRKRCGPVCLFGAPDPLETEKSYEEAMMASRDSFLKRWNFDVYTMEPSTQPGGLQWTAAWSEETTTATPGEERLTAVPEGATETTTCPEGRVRDSYAEVNTTSSLVGNRTGSRVRYSPYHKQPKLTDLWRSKKAPSSPALKSRLLSRKSEDTIAPHTHTHSQRESANVTI